MKWQFYSYLIWQTWWLRQVWQRLWGDLGPAAEQVHDDDDDDDDNDGDEQEDLRASVPAAGTEEDLLSRYKLLYSSIIWQRLK